MANANAGLAWATFYSSIPSRSAYPSYRRASALEVHTTSGIHRCARQEVEFVIERVEAREVVRSSLYCESITKRIACALSVQF